VRDHHEPVACGDPKHSRGRRAAILVDEVIAKNPELKFYEAEIAAARGGRRTAGEWANPELSTELGRKSVRDLGGNHLGDGPIWGVSLSQTFQFPGRQSLRKAIANRQIDLAQLGYEQFRAALALRARSLGYQLLAAQQRADAAAEVSKRFQDLLSVLVQREPAGVTPILETRIIEASAFILGRRASEDSIASNKALFELNQLRGLPVSTPLAVARTTLSLEAPPALEFLFGTPGSEISTSGHASPSWNSRGFACNSLGASGGRP